MRAIKNFIQAKKLYKVVSKGSEMVNIVDDIAFCDYKTEKKKRKRRVDQPREKVIKKVYVAK